MNFSLKVDVDTYEGMRVGVPQLLQLFKNLKIKASFFVPFGPDESGKAIFRIFKKKGFLSKMFRTNALKIYGTKTILRGTLLPAPMIGESFPEIVRSIEKEGHELGIHGYNHVLWQDHLLKMKQETVRKQFELGVAGFEKVMGRKPKGFAAPAWLCTPFSLKMVDEFQFSYASDTRLGKFPFYPIMDGQEFKTLQIPSTLPTADELLGSDNITQDNLGDHLFEIMKEVQLEFHVHTVHAEVEGMAILESFGRWLQKLRKENVDFIPCEKIKELLIHEPQKIPRSEIILKEIPGRSGVVSCQK
ncbi:MAG: hypothetical protein A3I11_01960 [Elusimicrobia bacterium RIFCSPLOWO2_02_FULL_39_32]|nr:MAG: hypothetical protein A2034_01580 [Elusimicrobia bacterium GWA2_38_7]OGR78384.1 MAG: hypothetical protein A3B80_06845 [Elusimicrobia bacterium RIFCSPHIGHO2_02_FULL_39_36]OGR92143.1 MAG: hypothetical protein A3I11_01960 [Elusimicrobia bacterium RIFCSPLOWO2_02_FULL_39_32]OGR99989.1 MAG: hypothetical protein A3G85_03475 [Elusimicrobia bacterium RIFCSPLOWO2_12_FULL_39_28]